MQRKTVIARTGSAVGWLLVSLSATILFAGLVSQSSQQNFFHYNLERPIDWWRVTVHVIILATLATAGGAYHQLLKVLRPE